MLPGAKNRRVSSSAETSQDLLPDPRFSLSSRQAMNWLRHSACRAPIALPRSRNRQLTTHPAVFALRLDTGPTMISGMIVTAELAAGLAADVDQPPARENFRSQLSTLNRFGNNTREKLGNPTDPALLQKTFDRMK
jgi:hypothetical protein